MLYLKELVRWLMEHLLKMKSKTIKFRDPVVENVVDKFVLRSDVGFKKYGRTLHSERTGKHKDLAGYLNDVQEELMDAILYIQAAREELVENQDLRHTIDETIAEANKASFRPPHPSNAAQIDWDDHVAPV
jgi:hypothetical protein